MDLVDASVYPELARVVGAVLDEFPDHRPFIESSFRHRDADLLGHSETVAEVICKLSGGLNGGLAELAQDYRYLCQEIVLPEELHFRRNGAYRLSTFKQAYESVYGDPDLMRRYMNGLLVSNVAWINHCQALHHYASVFLPHIPEQASLLEIGPGHGLLLYLATLSDKVGRISAWDVSETKSRFVADDAGADAGASAGTFYVARRPHANGGRVRSGHPVRRDRVQRGA